MTIRRHSSGDDDDHSRDEDFITLSATWTVLLKIGLSMVPFCIAFGVWGVTKIFSHDQRLALLEYRIDHASNGSNTNSVSIGGMETSDADESHKETLSTEDVAKKEKVTSRTVINWIEGHRIDPPPVKNGKSWAISANYRLLPQTAENFGNADSIEKDCKP